ncbi:MAG: hypothetical protein OIN66_09530 [Candidatus Methanoperedens sp.]|nr:hypothetical protein [Candidatus Methanoperedens sp.]
MQKPNEEQPENRNEEITKDSLFDIVGSFRTKEGNWSERDDWREQMRIFLSSFALFHA